MAIKINGKKGDALKLNYFGATNPSLHEKRYSITRLGEFYIGNFYQNFDPYKTLISPFVPEQFPQLTKNKPLAEEILLDLADSYVQAIVSSIFGDLEQLPADKHEKIQSLALDLAKKAQNFFIKS